MIYYVDQSVTVSGDGSKEHPFLRIGEAAAVAMSGDEVVVCPGIYREDVNPIFGGCGRERVTYRSEKLHEAVITGAEVFTTWENHKGDVWKLEIENRYFGSYNPYTTLVSGDWLNIGTPVHTGDRRKGHV